MTIHFLQCTWWYVPNLWSGWRRWITYDWMWWLHGVTALEVCQHQRATIWGRMVLSVLSQWHITWSCIDQWILSNYQWLCYLSLTIISFIIIIQVLFYSLLLSCYISWLKLLHQHPEHMHHACIYTIHAGLWTSEGGITLITLLYMVCTVHSIACICTQCMKWLM